MPCLPSPPASIFHLISPFHASMLSSLSLFYLSIPTYLSSSRRKRRGDKLITPIHPLGFSHYFGPLYSSFFFTPRNVSRGIDSHVARAMRVELGAVCTLFHVSQRQLHLENGQNDQRDPAKRPAKRFATHFGVFLVEIKIFHATDSFILTIMHSCISVSLAFIHSQVFH